MSVGIKLVGYQIVQLNEKLSTTFIKWVELLKGQSLCITECNHHRTSLALIEMSESIEMAPIFTSVAARTHGTFLLFFVYIILLFRT